MIESTAEISPNYLSGQGFIAAINMKLVGKVKDP